MISPFKSLLSLVQEKFPFLPVGLLLTSPFRSDLDMPKVRAPILILHGTGDTLIPFASGRALGDLARAQMDFVPVPGAGHNNGMFTDDTIGKIYRFTGFDIHQL